MDPSPIDIVISGDREEKRLKASVVATILVPEWSDAKPEDIKTSTLTGGITNKLYKCTLGEQSVLVRHYGNSTEKIVDRKKEGKVFRLLHSAGQGARFFGEFGNGCVYEFIPGTALTPKQLHEEKIVCLIADCLGRFHRECTPLAKEFGLGPIPEESRLWSCIERWMAQLPPSLDHVKNEEHKAEYSTMGLNLALELSEMRRRIGGHGEPLVLCHNDLLAGNILLREDVGGGSRGVCFIDYEYCDYNHRTFDVGNHFCEHMGFDVKPENYPSADTQELFASAYLNAYDGKTPSSEATASFLAHVRACATAAHLYWGVWALLQAYISALDFDYFGYGLLRLRAYLDMKADL